MSFDALAPHYRWMELVLAGGKLQRCRTAFLDRVISAQNVLIVGEGNGRFLVECRRALPDARITVTDASARMLASARARLLRQGLALDHIKFVHADALAWEPDEGAHDLVVTHYFLDCFPAAQLHGVIGRLSRAAKPSAAWLLADFQVPDHGLARSRALLIHAMMYGFFRLATRLPARRLVPPDDFLKAQDFKLGERQTSDWGLLRSDFWTRGEFYSPSAAATSARSRSCSVTRPRTLPFGSSSTTTISAADSINFD